ncbi:hypothetical protein HY468_05175 [Candidatus Roizmanbacteria bacterium]|nr:hypothetical protein [Candidatus Roizmanbacteria bacterium]
MAFAAATTPLPSRIPTPDTSTGATGTPQQQMVDYLLPYPGMLADHPLYPLKLLRDRLLDFLIRDPVKRVEFNLLMADKRLAMGIALTEKGNHKLAEETVSKGEKYFVLSLDELQRAKEQNRDIHSSLLDRLAKSGTKHNEVVQNLKKQSPEDIQKGYDTSLSLIAENRERIVSFGR